VGWFQNGGKVWLPMGVTISYKACDANQQNCTGWLTHMVDCNDLVYSVVTVTVEPGWDPSAVTKAAMRGRSFSSGPGGEIYLGKPDLGVGANRVEKDFYGGTTCDGSTPYGSWQSSNHVKFWYVPGDGKIYAEVTASHNYCLEYVTGSLGSLDYVQLDVVNRASGTTVNFMNVTVNGTPVGDFVASGWQNWMVKGLDLSAGFVIEGDLVLAGSQPGGETNKLEIKVGDCP
jgi:hypothetical protein